METFISSGSPHEIKGRGVVRHIKPSGYGDVTWGELKRIREEKEWIQLDCDIVTIAGVEAYAIMKDDDKKFHHPIGILIGDIRETS